MSWIRLSDSFIDHPKFLVLSDGAFRLWQEGLAFCRKHQTDGLIPSAALQGFRYVKPARVTELSTPLAGEGGPLWEGAAPVGYRVRNYLKWNAGKEEEQAQRTLAKHRQAFLTDKSLRRTLRERDGDACRYCGIAVNWLDRKGAAGATYDHVDPRGDATVDNLVIACRGCNSRKRQRPLAETGMRLLAPPAHQENLDRNLPPHLSRNLDGNLDSTGMDRKRKDLNRKDLFRGSGSSGSSGPAFSAEVADRAAALLEAYRGWFTECRSGARLRLTASPVDWAKACDLCALWDDPTLEKLARIFLTTDDDWISQTGREFSVFALKASWCDGRLREWETKQKALARA